MTPTPMRLLVVMMSLPLLWAAPSRGAAECDDAASGGKPLIEPGQRVLVLGDSITHAGGYVNYVNAHLAVRYPDRAYHVVGVGLPSETACGLSEPYHPFPRPDAHERLGRALEKFKPDVVVACYGMNDGVYHPFSEDRFKTYQDGIDKLVADCRAAGAKVILVTPPPYDAKANPKSTRDNPDGSTELGKRFGYSSIYVNYDDEVIARYAAWIVERGKKDDVLASIDIHTPIKAYLAKMRETNPGFKMSGDGVHVNGDGHRQIAAALLAGLGFAGADLSDEAVGRVMPLVAQRDSMLRDAWLSEIGHKRPGMRPGLPIDEAQKRAAELDAKTHEAAAAKP